MIKLVVSDVDGTILLRNQTKPDDAVLSAIEKLKNCGKTVAVASGRTYAAMEKMFHSVKKDMYFICCAGAVAICNAKGIYCQQIGIGDVIDVVRRPEYKDCGIGIATPTRIYILQGGKDGEAFYKTATEQSLEEIHYLDKLYDLKEPVAKISVWFKGEAAQPLKFMPKSLRVSYLAGEWCEYTSAISDKGLAISDLQMRLYLSKFDTAAIGDGINDVVMMKKAKIAASANKSHPALDEICNYHTDDVAGFLNKLCEE